MITFWKSKIYRNIELLCLAPKVVFGIAVCPQETQIISDGALFFKSVYYYVTIKIWIGIIDRWQRFSFVLALTKPVLLGRSNSVSCVRDEKVMMKRMTLSILITSTYFIILLKYYLLLTHVLTDILLLLCETRQSSRIKFNYNKKSFTILWITSIAWLSLIIRVRMYYTLMYNTSRLTQTKSLEMIMGREIYLNRLVSIPALSTKLND